MKYLIGLVAMLLPIFSARAQNGILITGKVISESGNAPVADATISLRHQKQTTYTNASGAFSIPLYDSNDEITVSHVGFLSQTIPVSKNTSSSLIITLQDTTVKLDEVVVNTGYQSLPKERATGSFVQIDNKLLTGG